MSIVNDFLPSLRTPPLRRAEPSTAEHLKRIHPTKLNPITHNEDDPDNQLIQTTENTFNMWTFDSNKSYITVTCHFIFDDQLYSPVIATKEVSDRHTGQNIAATLTNIFNDWNIANKIITVVSDNGSNIKNAINEHLLKHHHPCVAHTLNLIGHFKHSSNATEKLKDFQLQMNLPPLKVKQDVPTRWNSSFIMMERLVNIKAPLSATMSTLPRAPNYLNASEWEIILDCTHILKPFQIMTAKLSGEKYPTLSVVIPLIRGLQHILRNLKTETDVGDVFRNMLMDIVSRRLGILEKNKIVAKATFLDPRFKKTAFGLLENASNAQKWVSEELTMMISTNTKMENEINTTESTTALTLNSTNNTTESLWEHFDNKAAQVKTTSNSLDYENVSITNHSIIKIIRLLCSRYSILYKSMLLRQYNNRIKHHVPPRATSQRYPSLKTNPIILPPSLSGDSSSADGRALASLRQKTAHFIVINNFKTYNLRNNFFFVRGLFANWHIHVFFIRSGLCVNVCTKLRTTISHFALPPEDFVCPQIFRRVSDILFGILRTDLHLRGHRCNLNAKLRPTIRNRHEIITSYDVIE
ncbi:hypothetical protein QTP88_016538 [Uroleucon formosanum]